MRPSLRFLGLVVFGWAGVRAATLGVLPGAEIFRVEPSEAKPPPIVPTQFPAIQPVQPATPFAAADRGLMQPAGYPGSTPVRYVQGAVGVPVAMRPGVVTVYQLPPPTPATPSDLPPASTHFSNAPATFSLADYSTFPAPDRDPLFHISALGGPTSGPAAIPAEESRPAPIEHSRIDRWQLTSWAYLRAQSAGVAGSQSLASGGSLGASQAGARLMYNFNRQIAATLRSSSDVGRRGGEVAAGMRIQPIAGLPLWIDAERRQRLGRYGGGRSAFALFFEAGLYDRPMPLHFLLDAYLQGGVVGLHSRDKFIDGGVTFTRPVYKRFSAGFGVWGGTQPGLSRVDAGPRVTMRVRKNIKVHFDWRQRLAGNAQPGSGPAVTLAGDF